MVVSGFQTWVFAQDHRSETTILIPFFGRNDIVGDNSTTSSGARESFSRRPTVAVCGSFCKTKPSRDYLGAPPGTHVGRKEESASHRIGTIIELIERVMNGRSIFANSSLGRW